MAILDLDKLFPGQITVTNPALPPVDVTVSIDGRSATCTVSELVIPGSVWANVSIEIDEDDIGDFVIEFLLTQWKEGLTVETLEDVIGTIRRAAYQGHNVGTDPDDDDEE